jgi:hypothetical protein
MKKIFVILFFICSTIVLSQVPQGITYQAIALNGSGNQLLNTNIKLRLSIVDNTATGAVLYTETHAKTTNDKGLYTLVIGQGTPVTGTFSSIDWGKNNKYLKVEMDATGGTNYTVVGSTQMLSVPYALYSGKTASVAGNMNINEEIQTNKNGNFAFAATDGYVYAYNAKLNKWSSQLGRLAEFFSDGTFIFYTASLSASNENFAFPATDGYVYVYNARTDSWSSQLGRLEVFGSGSIASVTGVIVSNGNFAFSATDGYIYVYNTKLNAWSSQLGRLIDQSNPIVGSKGNYAFSATDGYVYVYNAKQNLWSSQLGRLESYNKIQSFESNGNFAFAATDGYVYVYNEKSNTWSSQLGRLSGNTGIVTSPSN